MRHVLDPLLLREVFRDLLGLRDNAVINVEQEVAVSEEDRAAKLTITCSA